MKEYKTKTILKREMTQNFFLLNSKRKLQNTVQCDIDTVNNISMKQNRVRKCIL